MSTPPPVVSKQERALTEYLAFQAKAVAMITDSRGSITRAGVFAQIAANYLVEAQLRPDADPIPWPDTPAPAASWTS